MWERIGQTSGMSAAPSDSHSANTHALSQSRGWLIFSGLLSIFVGFVAMGSPLLFSVVIAQLLGIFALVSGVISLFLAIFTKHSTHRVLDGLLALIRIAAGIILLRCVASSIAVITLILAIFLIIEGISFIIGAFQMRQHGGWVWTLINGIAALVLGVMVYTRWPSDSTWILGLFYGINSIFWGVSLLSMGLAAPKVAKS
jgi:uncharacterized membrane protein HdeD (DUF308 family)